MRDFRIGDRVELKHEFVKWPYLRRFGRVTSISPFRVRWGGGRFDYWTNPATVENVLDKGKV